MFNQIITIFNYIYMLLLKSDILQTECLAFPGKDKCNKCNLKTIYSPSPRWENIAYMYCANIYLYIYMCMYIYIYIYVYIYMYIPKAESFVACCNELYFVLSLHHNWGRKLKIKRPTGCPYYLYLPSIFIFFVEGDKSNIRWILCFKTVKRS